MSIPDFPVPGFERDSNAPKAVAEGKMKIVLAEYEPDPYLVHLGPGPLALKMRAFLDFVAPRLRKPATKASLTTR